MSRPLALILAAFSLLGWAWPPARPAPALGGPDAFGYTFDDAVPFSWIDATGGTAVPLTGDDSASGPIEIGFRFPFYDFAYEQAYLNTNGLLSFGAPTTAFANTATPSPAAPDNLIAVFWDDLAVGSPFNAGAVYILRGGTAPNRYFVAEWHAVTRYGVFHSDPLTFQVVLHENGDILLQYLSLSGSLDQATAGLEDDLGEAGLLYRHNAPGLSSGLAVRFFRPAPAARVRIAPREYGAFATADEAAVFTVPLRNSGDLGFLPGPAASDTFDLEVESPWPVRLLGPNSAPLGDTDLDGVVDTGPVAAFTLFTVTVEASPPAGAGIGASAALTLTARSSANTAAAATAALAAAVPAPFAQAYRDLAGGLEFYAVTGAGQITRRLPANGASLTVAEAPNGVFAYAWSRANCPAQCVAEIHYTLLDHSGWLMSSASAVVQHAESPVPVQDLGPAVAAAPDGRFGLAWYRRAYSAASDARSDNLYVAILDPDGRFRLAPLSLTGFTAYGAPGTSSVPQVLNPRIAAFGPPGDSRFLIAWEQTVTLTPGQPESDLYYAVLRSDGTVLRPPTALTDAAPGGPAFLDPAPAPLPESQAIVAYNAGGQIAFARLDAGGSVLQAETLGAPGTRPDAALLAGGQLLLAWSDGPEVRYALLGGAPLAVLAGPSGVQHLGSPGGSYPSVAAEAGGRGIVTWMDSAALGRHLYYALVDGNGLLLTPAMIFRSSRAGLETSPAGSGVTSYAATGLQRVLLPGLLR